MTTTIQTIPLNRLVHSKANVRRTGRGRSLEGLMASIATHGLRQNLNVRPTSGNRFEVVAGGRRLEALRRLAAGGDVEKTLPVNCLVLDEGENALELSLVENAIREDMHPDDQCAAFAELVEQGMPVEDVAARFGVTPTVVKQRLRLAAVAPSLRARYREGELTLAQMMAFALVEDHARQEQVWAELPEWSRTPESIRRALTAEGLAAGHRLSRFVGLEAYEAAGGAVLRNLFEEEPPMLADGALVERLAIEKLEAEAATLRAEGWKWVTVELSPSYGYGWVQPDEGEDGAETFRPEDVARAGARVCLDYSGAVQIDRGLLDADAMKAEREAERAEQAEDAEEEAEGSPQFPDSVLVDLTAHRTAALRLELARNTKVALASVVHTLGLRVLYGGIGNPTCLGLSHTSEYLGPLIKTPEEGSAAGALTALVAAWRQELPDAGAFWGWCLEADTDKLLELLAIIAGVSVNAVQRGRGRGDPLRQSDVLATALGLDMTKHWTPLAGGFFGRLTKAQLAAQLVEAEHTDVAGMLAARKKTEAAELTATTLGDGWLPQPLRP
ncbi:MULTISPECIES: ParB/RepB/Spo0J family partition protein [unclassified Devosia]|jgi:ParB family chromosome partitioning protein|uniref:ParB/RepB/Spo0J family partition protein n=1 Tax=unclassified Devosia TaxID=196773 RepID=UPI00086F1E38|nr:MULTISPECIES: ParB/RepB/Spo0J family partition protein [unclassified Devosia]MBN9361770.1 ParB/RepB/Spo0J family partition protein [Devosia sp.]ODS87613.1 MAG: hypothetical protein ABS47_11790 [Devosia sp. SCN 66-27]OJX26796.1 MAG: hypothetical protein BGO83_23425 [Devosia sp. 66-14]